MFGYNAATYPESWNAHDSFAEALAATGETQQAIAEYQRSLSLNRKNENAVQMITRLKGK